MPRFLSWLAIGAAATFLVVVSVSFSLTTIGTLAFAISIGTLVVSAGIAVFDRRYAPSLVTAVVVAVISVWTIVASLVFSPATVQHLALGAGGIGKRSEDVEDSPESQLFADRHHMAMVFTGRRHFRH